jgi:hypothetical protein
MMLNILPRTISLLAAVFWMNTPNTSAFLLPQATRTLQQDYWDLWAALTGDDSTTSFSSDDNHDDLPPGRPTKRPLSFFCDDTIRLLNPEEMKLLNRKSNLDPFPRPTFSSVRPSL